MGEEREVKIVSSKEIVKMLSSEDVEYVRTWRDDGPCLVEESDESNKEENPECKVRITFWMMMSFILTLVIIYMLNCPINPNSNNFECK